MCATKRVIVRHEDSKTIQLVNQLSIIWVCIDYEFAFSISRSRLRIKREGNPSSLSSDHDQTARTGIVF
jgi:hypothetical protein